ncbi:hypothetical protein HOP50_01g08660 [Chloropicon primus]|uniref:Transmembrane protein 135 N-terminal domain-containing protein n=1 Tax=Chloropicon primus TaxID=1764295 RepID=A0A5B8MG84_9CHLO|nr:hypothetical protein A3770_01p08780 [Chloropicon primus]UPQ97571.1 hypothetical protein HOP50_01g08660 [Chloropicon primus]|eukprot:QDZ18360.1 hypothetical protein A3770_01p08780 [Chloropicon primus]
MKERGERESGTSGRKGGIWEALDKVTTMKFEEEDRRALERLQNATVRGAAIGFILRGGYVSFSMLTSALLRRKKHREAGVTNANSLVSVVRWTAFLGSLGGSYVALDEGLLRFVGKKKSRKWRGLVSGTVAGSSVCMLGRKDPQYTIAIYVVLRALWLFLRRSRRSTSKLLRTVSAPLALPHADVLVMCTACTQILFAWLMEPKTLPNTYRKFLDKHCGKPEWMIQSISEMIRHNHTKGTGRKGPAFQEWHRLVPPGEDYLKKCRTPYGLVMQNRYQILHHIQFFLSEYKRKIPVYIPVYFLPALVVHRWNLFTKPRLGKSILYKCVKGTMQSALFLTTFCTFAWTFTCGSAYFLVPFVGKEGLGMKWLAGSFFPIGSSIICEKKSRRKEIAVYCSARALESFALCALTWGWIPKKLQFKRFDVVLFSVGVGLIMHCYTDSEGDYRHTLRGKYLNVLDFVFGNTGHTKSKIRHVPSTSDLARGFFAKKRKEQLTDKD